jgi:hypothetical protein
LLDFAVGAMPVGAIFLAVERVIQAILRIPYGARYNKTLRNGLKVTKDGGDALGLSLSVGPVIRVTELGMQVAATIHME